jgi:hypothetical protein
MVVQFWVLLLMAHAVCDYPLQGDFLARAKNHRAPVDGIPWWQALTAHALIHGWGVWLLTDSPGLGMLEVCLHWIIDWLKSEGVLTFNEDQAAHVLCKLAYTAMLFQ